MISVVAVSTRRAPAPSATSNEISAAEAGIADVLDRCVLARAGPRAIRRRLGLAADADARASSSPRTSEPGGVGRRDDPGARAQLAQPGGVLRALA